VSVFRFFILSILLLCCFLEAENRFEEALVEQIDLCFRLYGLDLNDPVSYETTDPYNTFLIHDMLQTKSCLLLASTPPILTSTAEYTAAAAFIITGLALYTNRVTRPTGIWLIRFGFSIIGYNQLEDFCGYLTEKGYFSDKDQNIFRGVLGSLPTETNKGNM
jgi:hypothetical protein